MWHCFKGVLSVNVTCRLMHHVHCEICLCVWFGSRVTRSKSNRNHGGKQSECAQQCLSDHELQTPKKQGSLLVLSFDTFVSTGCRIRGRMFYRLDGNWVSGQGHMLGFVVWFSCSYWKNLGPLPRRMMWSIGEIEGICTAEIQNWMWVGSILRIDPDITPFPWMSFYCVEHGETMWNIITGGLLKGCLNLKKCFNTMYRWVSNWWNMFLHFFFLELYTSSQNKSFEDLHFILMLSSFWHISIWNPIGRVLGDSFPSGYFQNFGFHVKFDEFAGRLWCQKN